jgi:hypothetical protein
VAVCPDPVTLTDDGANQVVTGTAMDKAGNSSTATVSVSKTKTKTNDHRRQHHRERRRLEQHRRHDPLHVRDAMAQLLRMRSRSGR